jgi:hypothetical protein
MKMSAILLGTFACAILLATGCASQSGGTLTPEQEEANASEDDLRATATKLAGTFSGSAGEGIGAGIEKVVFTKAGTFFAVVDSGLRCVRAPCPSSLRIEGTFKATAKYLRLLPLAGAPASEYHGRYTYTFTGEALTLNHTGPTPYESTLTRKPESFCEQVSDCSGQPQPNRLTCVPAPRVVCGEDNQCSNTCAPRALTADGAISITVSSQGGLLPPLRPGSTCRLGSSYTLEMGTKTLTWDLCRSVGGAPFTAIKGSKVLVPREVGQVERTLDKVQLSGQQNCGADAPKKALKIKSTAGEAVYIDDFYACEGTATYVENLGEALSVFEGFANVSQ